MSKFFLTCDGEPRIVEHTLTTNVSVTKTSPNVVSPRLDRNNQCITIYVEPTFNALLPVQHRMVIPTGLTFHFQEGFIGNLYSMPNQLTNQGIYVVSQVITNDNPLYITVLNYGSQDRAIFAEMPIAQMVLCPSPRISKLKIHGSSHSPTH